MITGSGSQSAQWAPFQWVNTALGNIKTALVGTYHHVSAKHAQRYLASFAWRLTARRLARGSTLTERLAYACARTVPHPYKPYWPPCSEVNLPNYPTSILYSVAATSRLGGRFLVPFAGGGPSKIVRRRYPNEVKKYGLE